MLRTISITMAFLTLAGAAAWAGVPSGITYQGRLTDGLGVPVADGTYSLKFVIYNAGSGGAILWDNGYGPVTVTGGQFTYVLGSYVPLPVNLFADTSRWLGVTVSGGVEMTPRVRLLGTPYAHQARAADSAGTVHWSNVQGLPVDIGNAVTEVVAGSGLTGGGSGGAVTLSIPTNGINSGHIASGAVTNAEIAANAVASGQILDGSVSSADIGDEAGGMGVYRSLVSLPDWGGTFTSDVVIASVVVNAPTSGVVLLVASGWFALEHAEGTEESFARVSVGKNNVGGIIDLENFASFSVPGGAASGTYRTSFSVVALELVGAGSQTFHLRGARRTGALCDVGDAHLDAIFLPTVYGSVETSPSPKAAPEDLDAFGEPAAR